MSELRLAPFRLSLSRQSTIMGGERAPMSLVIFGTMMLIVLGMTWVTFVLGSVFGVVGVTGLRKAYRVHPQMFRVYLRSLRYKPYYPARMTYNAPKSRCQVYQRGRKIGWA